jgi:excinuclease ABC subunit C
MPELKDQLAQLPDEPGIYRFYRADGQLIYVGKAKSLKKRVASYFSRQAGQSLKTEKLIAETHRLEYTLVQSEFDALLLENSFIKRYQPRYNILLRDDKTFPFLCIPNERFPRIIYTRRVNPKQGRYFGPFSSAAAMKNVLELVRKLYSIRTCNLALTEENVRQSKFKVCLEYHIGNCQGPCAGLQTEAAYAEEIEQARHVLKGNLSVVAEYFKNKIKACAEALEFEKAAHYKQRLDLLDKFHAKSTVVSPRLSEIDVAAIAGSSQYAYVHYMQVREGAVVFSKNVLVRKPLDEPDADVLSNVVYACREEYHSEHSVILTNEPILVNELTHNEVPQRGDKKALVDMALKNALHQKTNHEKALSEAKERLPERVLRLQTDLRLKAPPRVIECFDNSNLMGSAPVASMVRFVNGKPDRQAYRHFNIKTVTGANDFASMKEIVGRRYQRLKEENETLPDLVVVDGGKGQLSSACEALADLGLYGKIPIIGIAKKLEEIYFPEDTHPLHLHKKSAGLFLLQQIRDEAHRFAVGFHRKKRSQAALSSELSAIKGLGEKSIGLLLKQFGSPKKVFDAPEDELIALLGKRKAMLIRAYKNTEDTNSQRVMTENEIKK